MATKQDKYIQDLIESIKNKNKPDIESVAKYDPAKQAAGLETRLEASGIKPDKLDKRNFIEKALNLTPNQNALFDVFEIINRPQQMLFQGIKAAQEDEDVFKAVRKGFGGVGDDVRFKEILHNMDVEDSGKDFGADDVLGFAGDVFADPIDLALVVATPFTGGASGAALAAKKGVQAADTTLTGLKATKTALEAAQIANKVDNAADIARVTSQIEKVTNTRQLWQNLDDAANNLSKVKELAKKGDATGYADAFDAYKKAIQPLKKRMTPLEYVFKQTKGGLNKSINLLDDGITGVLGKLDAHVSKVQQAKIDNILADTTKIPDVKLRQETAQKLIDEFGKVGSKGQWYKDFKTSVGSIFDAAKAIPKGLWEKSKEITGSKNVVLQRLVKIQEQNVKDIAKLATDTGMNPDEIATAFMKAYEMQRYVPEAKLGTLFDASYINYNPMNVENFDKFKKYIIENMTEEGLPKYSDDVIEGLFTKTKLTSGVEVYLPKQGFGDKKFLEDMLDDVNKFMKKQAKYNEKLGAKITKATDDLANYRKQYDDAVKFVQDNKINFKQVENRYVPIIDDATLDELNKLGLGLKKGQDGTVNFATAIKRIDNRVKNIDKQLDTLGKQGFNYNDLKKEKEALTNLKDRAARGKSFLIDDAEQVKLNKVVSDTWGTEDATADVIRRRVDGGGITVINGKAIDANKGYQVAFDKTQEIPVDTVEDVVNYVTKNKIESYGVWKNGDKYIIDPTSRYVDDANVAGIVGMFGDQDRVMSWKHLADEDYAKAFLSPDEFYKTFGKNKPTVKVNKTLMSVDDAKKALNSLKDKMKKAQNDLIKRNDDLVKGAKNTNINMVKRQQDLVNLANSAKKLDFENPIKASRYYGDMDVQQVDEFLKDPAKKAAYDKWQKQMNYMYEDIKIGRASCRERV